MKTGENIRRLFNIGIRICIYRTVIYSTFVCECAF